MVTSGADQAVRQHGALQMSNSDVVTFLASSLGHVFISDAYPQLKAALGMNATQMPHK